MDLIKCKIVFRVSRHVENSESQQKNVANKYLKNVQCVQIRSQLLSIITIYQNKLYFK